MDDMILGSIGTTLNMQIYETDGHTPIALATATKGTLIVRFPDGITTQFHNCTIVVSSTPGVNDYVMYVTQSGDFPTVGTYLLEVQVIFPTGAYNSELLTIRVGDSIIPSTPV